MNILFQWCAYKMFDEHKFPDENDSGGVQKKQGGMASSTNRYCSLSMEYREFSDYQQALMILFFAKYLHDVEGATLIPIPFSATPELTQQIAEAYRENKPIVIDIKGGQAEVVRMLLSLQKNEAFSSLRDVIQLVPIATRPQRGNGAPVLPEAVFRESLAAARPILNTPGAITLALNNPDSIQNGEVIALSVKSRLNKQFFETIQTEMKTLLGKNIWEESDQPWHSRALAFFRPAAAAPEVTLEENQYSLKSFEKKCSAKIAWIEWIDALSNITIPYPGRDAKKIIHAAEKAWIKKVIDKSASKVVETPKELKSKIQKQVKKRQEDDLALFKIILQHPKLQVTLEECRVEAERLQSASEITDHPDKLGILTDHIAKLELREQNKKPIPEQESKHDMLEQNVEHAPSIIFCPRAVAEPPNESSRIGLLVEKMQGTGLDKVKFYNDCFPRLRNIHHARIMHGYRDINEAAYVGKYSKGSPMDRLLNDDHFEFPIGNGVLTSREVNDAQENIRIYYDPALIKPTEIQDLLAYKESRKLASKSPIPTLNLSDKECSRYINSLSCKMGFCVIRGQTWQFFQNKANGRVRETPLKLTSYYATFPRLQRDSPELDLFCSKATKDVTDRNTGQPISLPVYFFTKDGKKAYQNKVKATLRLMISAAIANDEAVNTPVPNAFYYGLEQSEQLVGKELFIEAVLEVLSEPSLPRQFRGFFLNESREDIRAIIIKKAAGKKLTGDLVVHSLDANVPSALAQELDISVAGNLMGDPMSPAGNQALLFTEATRAMEEGYTRCSAGTVQMIMGFNKHLQNTQKYIACPSFGPSIPEEEVDKFRCGRSKEIEVLLNSDGQENSPFVPR